LVIQKEPREKGEGDCINQDTNQKGGGKERQSLLKELGEKSRGSFECLSDLYLKKLLYL